MTSLGLLEPGAVKAARRVLRGPRRSDAPGLPDWRIGGEGAWLWVAATEDATVYDVARGRGFEQATGLVPEDYEGVIVRDGWVVYNRYDKARHQTCVAHYAAPAIMRRGRPGALWALRTRLRLSA